MKALILAGLLLLTALSVVPTTAAQDPSPCMPVYQRTDVGTISIVRKDSCSLEVYQCPYAGAPTWQCQPLLG